MPIRGKTAAEVTSEDVRQLVRDNAAEDQYLDFKKELLPIAKPAKQSDDEKDDLLADIIAFANGAGGHIIVGIETDAQERACLLVPTTGARTKQLADQIRDLAAAHIKPAIVQLEVSPLAVDQSRDEWVMVLAIPDSNGKPHLSSFREQTRFAIRILNRKREMRYEEIRGMFLETPQQLRLTQLITKIESLRLQTSPGAASVNLSGLELWEIKDANLLLRRMQENFAQLIGETRFFRMTATPTTLDTRLIDLGDRELRQILEHPPFRESGWTVKAPAPLRRTAEGLESADQNGERLILLKNGHLEFWKAVDWLFCWNQEVESMQTHPRLYPYPVVEYPVTFARMYRMILNRLTTNADVIFQMQYSNIAGAILLPYRPESIGYAMPTLPVVPIQKSSIVVEPRQVSEKFDPDPIVFSMLEDVYAAFGYERKHIPFFDATDHCTL